VAEISGGSAQAVLSQNFRTICSWRANGILELAEAVLADGVTKQIETELATSFGKQVFVRYFLSHFIVEGESFLMVIGQDITEERRLEEHSRSIEAQMLHAQKLESLGVLAGGIAHDFNNILTSIIGNADLALLQMDPASSARENVIKIEKAAQRAAELSRQMLAYSGKGNFVIAPIDLNEIIDEMTKLLEVSISKRTILRSDLDRNLPAVDADATQLRQIIMNLVINASESLDDHNGRISISTGTMECDQAYLSEIWINDGLPAGLYVFLEITDTGCGMNKETLSKIFEPFFTTKFTGRGLGMAAVLGIVRGHKGAIKVYSEIGLGTSFKILLPVANSEAITVPDRLLLSTETLQGSGTVLLVDDEEAIRDLGKEMLEGFGYDVLTARSGLEAVKHIVARPNDIDCVILDLNMPHMDGEQAFREIRLINPKMRVVMSSGYNEHEVMKKFIGKDLARFIQKPYKLAELGRKVQEVIGNPSA
jgi:signal transduction histidine kinase